MSWGSWQEAAGPQGLLTSLCAGAASGDQAGHRASSVAPEKRAGPLSGMDVTPGWTFLSCPQQGHKSCPLPLLGQSCE